LGACFGVEALEGSVGVGGTCVDGRGPTW
jgi:hypothetical protein